MCNAILLQLLDKGNIINVTGYAGGAVWMKCGFSRGYTVYDKYFCKMVPPKGPGCEHRVIFHAGEKDQLKTEDRFSMLYNSSANTSYVEITGLTKVDNGRYRCGVDIPVDRNRQVTVDEIVETNLIVKDGESKLVISSFPCGLPK